MKTRARVVYHEARAQWWLGWLLLKWGGLDPAERALGRRQVLANLTMARALRGAA